MKSPGFFRFFSLSPLFRLPSLFVLCQCKCAVCAFAFRLPHTHTDFLSSFFFCFFFLLPFSPFERILVQPSLLHPRIFVENLLFAIAILVTPTHSSLYDVRARARASRLQTATFAACRPVNLTPAKAHHRQLLCGFNICML